MQFNFQKSSAVETYCQSAEAEDQNKGESESQAHEYASIEGESQAPVAEETNRLLPDASIASEPHSRASILSDDDLVAEDEHSDDELDVLSEISGET